MQREKCKCKAIQWQTVHSMFLILNRELDANEDREGDELPRSIHWHWGSSRTSLWQSRDVSVTSTGWINCAFLEAEFIKYGIILESESDFLSLQCSALTPGPFEGLECYFLHLWFVLLHFYFLFFFKCGKQQSTCFSLFHPTHSGMPNTFHCKIPNHAEHSMTLWFGEVLLLVCLSYFTVKLHWN